jgi:pilus assembly protein CpaE
MNTLTVMIKVNDRSAIALIESALSSTGGYIVQPENCVPRDLLIYEITDTDTEEQFIYLKEAMALGRARHLFLISSATDPRILIQALKIGAKEFFPLPLNVEDLNTALLKFRREGQESHGPLTAGAARVGNIIHVVGSKGGVGTTTIAVNLARHLSQVPDTKVALVDMNLLFGDIPIFLNMEHPLFDWAEIARNISRLDSNFLMGTLYKHPSGLYVLPSPTALFESIASAPEMITKLLHIMKSMFDYVIIDGGQHIGDMTKVIMKITDTIMIVTLLNLPCLINIRRLKDVFSRLGYPSEDRVLIVANRVNKRSAHFSLNEAERTTRTKIAFSVPNDFQNTMNAINTGSPLMEIAPGSEINKSLAEIAAHFQKQEIGRDASPKRGLFGSFRTTARVQ